MQVNATHKDPVKTGSLYNCVKLFESAGKPDEWFTMHIAVKGDTLRVSVNDKVLYEYVPATGSSDHSSPHQQGRDRLSTTRPGQRRAV